MMVHSKDSGESGAQSRTLLLAEELQKSYGNRVALRGLTFSLKAGRVLGFLGPNGAGKTTAIRILTTILEPTSGHFTVDGIDSQHPEEIRRKIGVLPESLGFPKQATAVEYLTFFGQLYGRTAADAKANSLLLLEEVGLQQRTKSLIGTYSRGMRQRLGIARALVNDPVVVFLDEPTLGLDPRGQQELLVQVRRIARERGTGVVLCSHLLTEVEGVCDDVVIMSSGQIVASGTVAEVIMKSRRNAIRIHVPTLAVDEAQKVLAALPAVATATPSEGQMGWILVELADAVNGVVADEAHVKNRVLEALIHADIPVLNFEAVGGRLQDVFLQVTEESIR